MLLARDADDTVMLLLIFVNRCDGLEDAFMKGKKTRKSRPVAYDYQLDQPDSQSSSSLLQPVWIGKMRQQWLPAQ